MSEKCRNHINNNNNKYTGNSLTSRHTDWGTKRRKEKVKNRKMKHVTDFVNSLVHEHLSVVDVILGVLEPVVDGGGVGLSTAADGDVISGSHAVQLTWHSDLWWN